MLCCVGHSNKLPIEYGTFIVHAKFVICMYHMEENLGGGTSANNHKFSQVFAAKFYHQECV